MTGKDLLIFHFITFSLIFNYNHFISVPMQPHGILHQLCGFLLVVVICKMEKKIPPTSLDYEN